MKMLLSIVLITISCRVYSQKVILKKTKTKKCSEEYFVLRSNKKIKHGPYRKFNIAGKLIAKGEFKKNEKSGKWAFYINDKMDQIYDYTSKKIVSFNNENQQYDVVLKTEIVNFKLDQPPMFIGGKFLLSEVINQYITYPKQAYYAARVLVAVTIGENDNLIDVQIVRRISEAKAGIPEFEQEVVKALKQIKNGWISGILDGKTIRSRCILEITFFEHLSGKKEIKVE